jgi:hypothetical protein
LDIFKEILIPALEEAKASMAKGRTFEIGPNLALMGKESAFDSLAFVSFIVTVEEQVYNVTGKTISLVDDKAFSSKNSPFQTAGTLASYISEKIDNE